MNDLFLLQNVSAGYVGNSPLFWGKGSSGYTQWIDEAEVFDSEAANAIMRSTSGSHKWVKWPVEVVNVWAKRTVDIQDLRKGLEAARVGE